MGPRGEEKWRPEKISSPEAREIRKGRWEGLSRKSGRGAEGNCLTHSAGESAELPSWSPLPPKPHQGHVGPGGIGRRPGRSGVVGGRGHPGGAEEKQRTIAPPTQAQGACRAPRLIPCPPSSLQAVWVLVDIGGRLGGSGKAGRRGSEEEAGEEQRASARPTQAQGAC